jgi:cobalt/nickel transport system ATP-binding protein
MSPALLELHDVYYTYPGSAHAAVQELSFTIPMGQKTAVLGHNGCGKSTLLFLIDGLYRCTSGTIYWQGQPLKYGSTSINQWRQRIGLAFQDPERQLVAATVAEDISYGLCNLQLSKAEISKRLQETLADFSLTELANSPLHHLSLGQKRRVALAGVMALQPELLLLDEPTAYLDNLQTRNLFQELDRIHHSGTTIIMATHDLDLAYAWADWVIVLHQGQIVMFNQTNTVFTNIALLEQFQLGMPMVLKVWYALPETLRRSQLTPPRTIAELCTYLLTPSLM